MAVILKASINLNSIPKDKIIDGKKGKYLPLTITINDAEDKFGNHGSITVEQSKEEREAKEQKVYLGNAKIVWTNGDVPQPSQGGGQRPQSKPKKVEVADDDLPF
jgi:hypothetical protein